MYEFCDPQQATWKVNYQRGIPVSEIVQGTSMLSHREVRVTQQPVSLTVAEMVTLVCEADLEALREVTYLYSVGLEMWTSIRFQIFLQPPYEKSCLDFYYLMAILGGSLLTGHPQ